MRANQEDVRSRNQRTDTGWNLGNVEAAFPASFQFDANVPPLVFFAAAQAAVTVKLPPSSGVGAAKKGQVIIFINRASAANTVTFNTSGGAAFTTALSVAQGAALRVVCTGDTSAPLGWLAW